MLLFIISYLVIYLLELFCILEVVEEVLEEEGW